MSLAFHYGNILKQNTYRKETHKHSPVYMNDKIAKCETFAQLPLDECWGSCGKEGDRRTQAEIALLEGEWTFQHKTLPLL